MNSKPTPSEKDGKVSTEDVDDVMRPSGDPLAIASGQILERQSSGAFTLPKDERAVLVQATLTPPKQRYQLISEPPPPAPPARKSLVVPVLVATGLLAAGIAVFFVISSREPAPAATASDNEPRVQAQALQPGAVVAPAVPAAPTEQAAQERAPGAPSTAVDPLAPRPPFARGSSKVKPTVAPGPAIAPKPAAATKPGPIAKPAAPAEPAAPKEPVKGGAFDPDQPFFEE